MEVSNPKPHMLANASLSDASNDDDTRCWLHLELETDAVAKRDKTIACRQTSWKDRQTDFVM